MRGDLLQRAGGGQSGGLDSLDDLLDFCQATLEAAELVPKGVQLLRKNFAFGALGRHRAEPILSLASGRPSGCAFRQVPSLRKRDTVLRAFWLRYLARQASAARSVRL